MVVAILSPAREPNPCINRAQWLILINRHGNWKNPRSVTFVVMLTVPRLTVVYSKDSVKAEAPIFSSSRSLGSERSRFSH